MCVHDKKIYDKPIATMEVWKVFMQEKGKIHSIKFQKKIKYQTGKKVKATEHGFCAFPKKEHAEIFANFLKVWGKKSCPVFRKKYTGKPIIKKVKAFKVFAEGKQMTQGNIVGFKKKLYGKAVLFKEMVVI